MLGLLAFASGEGGSGVQGPFKFKTIKLINAVSKMFLEASVLGLHATKEYGLSSNPSQGSSDYPHLTVCWISGPGASWWRWVAWRVVMPRKVVSWVLCRLARAACSFRQAMAPFDLGLLPSTQGGKVLQYLGSVACAGRMHPPTWAQMLVCRGCCLSMLWKVFYGLGTLLEIL